MSAISILFKDDILDAEQQEELRRYKYRGGDLSILYKYVLSPMAEFLVQNLVPTWMAPNLITLLGLMFNVLSATMTLIYDPTLTAAPAWLPCLTGICLFMYQTFDNMDGKQARKIGASSPLGLLFDHGCDALTGGLTVIPLASVFATGWNSTGMFTLWISTFITFYVQTWEEYYVHEMWLPIFNGPSEGIIIICGACFASGYFGTNWWQRPIFNVHESLVPMLPFQFLIVQVLLITLPSILRQVASVLCYLYNTTEINSIQRKEMFKQALLGLTMLCTFLASCFIWCFISKDALTKTGLQVVVYMMCTFFEMATHLMLMHTTSNKVDHGAARFLGWSALILPLNSFYGNYTNVYEKILTYVNKDAVVSYFTVDNINVTPGTSINFTLIPFVNEIVLINILTFVAVVYVTVKGCYTVGSIADALDVYVMTVKTGSPYYIQWAPNRRYATEHKVYGFWVPNEKPEKIAVNSTVAALPKRSSRIRTPAKKEDALATASPATRSTRSRSKSRKLA